MIDPEGVRRKATKLYRNEFLPSWIAGTDAGFFPHQLERCDLSRPKQYSATSKAITKLREGSKERLKRGYRVKWEWKNLKNFANSRNPVPDEIWIDTVEDLLWLCGERKRFADTQAVVEKVRSELPQLENWLRKNVKTLWHHADKVDGLIEVTRHVQSQPRPNCYLRELSVSVTTKFIEKNLSTLWDWFEIVLPPHAIDVRYSKKPSHFQRRFGFREKEVHVKLRLLDHRLGTRIGIRFDEFSLPFRHLQSLNLHGHTVFIIENETSFLLVPPRRHTLALWGKGDWVARLSEVEWLHDCHLIYWGDLDVDGFEALSGLRKYFGDSLQSVLMDEAATAAVQDYAERRRGPTPPDLDNLTPEETEAFRWCRHQRLEQERIPQAILQDQLRALAEVD